jgi:hypothetical protein
LSSNGKPRSFAPPAPRATAALPGRGVIDVGDDQVETVIGLS